MNMPRSAESPDTHPQPSLFDDELDPSVTTAMTIEEVRATYPAAIAAAALQRCQPSGDRDRGTQRMIDENGGGPPRETLAEDPPKQRRRDRRPISPRQGMTREEARAEDHEKIAKTTFRI